MNDPLFQNPSGESSPPRPLADRMRPVSLEEFIGQSDLVAPGKPLKRLIESGKIPSLILWGAPGSGKTTLARLMVAAARFEFLEISAVNSGVRELRGSIERARVVWRRDKRKTALFIDEIHRFSKVQQDAILPHVETGELTIIGSTTENPALEVIPALRSRCQIYMLKPLSAMEVEIILKRAVSAKEGGIGEATTIEEGVIERISRITGGDARAALSLLEASIHAATEETVTVLLVDELSKDSSILYDKMGQEHYDHASAYQKAMRGSDPNGAVYWLAKMLAGGEDPRFIARRLIVTASEDVGLADPAALLVAIAAAEAVDRIGMPECQIPLAHATIHVATAPKSNSASKAIKKAMDDITKNGESHSPPPHLRDTSYRAAKGYGFGKGYKYPHDYPGHWVEQVYLPEKLENMRYYEPGDQGRESAIADDLNKRKNK